MSNNMNTPPTIRWQLLSTVSALALLSSAYTAQAEGNDTDRPLIWIELSGQMENISGQGAPFAPAFLSVYPASSVLLSPTPIQAQKPPTFSFGEEGKFSFQPEGSDWLFSAGIRYGRSSNFRHVDHQTNSVRNKYVGAVSGSPATKENFSDAQIHHQEHHVVLDFSVGKDVGLGVFGREGSSALNLGVRFAQFTSGETFDLRARPDLQYSWLPSAASPTRFPFTHFHTYHATGQASRSFRGMGPSLSWNGSAPFAGNPQDGEIVFDWGANIALLFGRQKARVRHQESAHYDRKYYRSVYHHPSSSHPTNGHINSRNVAVPNVGGFAGLSYRYSDAKFSLGYRADFFFGAMDTGIDVAKKSNLAFNGPFASISFGLGD